MTQVSARLRSRIDRDFPRAADEVALLVGEASESERVQAAIVLWAHGDLGRLRDSVALTGLDWRDTLVRGDVAGEDWRERLDAELGPAV